MSLSNRRHLHRPFDVRAFISCIRKKRPQSEESALMTTAELSLQLG